MGHGPHLYGKALG